MMIKGLGKMIKIETRGRVKEMMSADAALCPSFWYGAWCFLRTELNVTQRKLLKHHDAH